MEEHEKIRKHGRSEFTREKEREKGRGGVGKLVNTHRKKVVKR